MRGLEQSRYQAQRSLRRRMSSKETQNPTIIAKVGNGAGEVVVSGRPGWVHVRLHGDDNQLTEAKLGIPLATAELNGAWVKVRRASARKASYYVVEQFVTSSSGNPEPPTIMDAVKIVLANRTGGERQAGDVVVPDPDNDESFVGTTVPGYQGKVFVVAETVANLNAGQVWERGGPFDVKVTGTVDRNDGLRTSATVYRAEVAPDITGGGIFAIALSPNISGEGMVRAVFLDALAGGGGGGNGGGNGGAWNLIEDIELTAPAASFDFQNIPGTYKHLAIVYSARGLRTETVEALCVRFNNSAVGYDFVRHRGGSQHYTDTSFGQTWISVILIPAASSPANSFGAGTIYIPDYTDTGKRKGMSFVGGYYREASTVIQSDTGWGEWQTTGSAITRITLIAANANLAVGSRATLYGIS